MEISGKKISIIGAERSGIAAAKLAIRKGAEVFLSDFSDSPDKREKMSSLRSANFDFELGGHSEKVWDCELIVTSPGVPSSAPVLSEAKERRISVISELEFASRFCEGKIIGITGTNGKTTATSLCTHTFNTGGITAYAAGNIGNAFSEIADTVRGDEVVCLEISSFQLDHIEIFKPLVGILLNITPDHLDRYENTLENYADSKFNLAKNQSGEEFFIYNSADKLISERLEQVRAQKIPFGLGTAGNTAWFDESAFFFNDEKVLDEREFSLRGEHNILNGLSVLAAAKILGVNKESIRKAFSTFEAVEHRLEPVREINGVKFVNDSKATNVDAVWYALRSFNEPIRLILGGKDKGNDYTQIKELVRTGVVKIYAIGSSAGKVKSFFDAENEVEICSTMEDAVNTAKIEAHPGDVVLLSPACASFDMFDNYEHRGEIFKQAVMDL